MNQTLGFRVPLTINRVGRVTFIRPTFPIHTNMADVEMKPADTKTKADDTKEGEKKKEEPKPKPSPVSEIKSNIALIERAVSTLEPRFTHRVLRTLTALRKRIDANVVRNAIEEVYVKGVYFIDHNALVLSALYRHPGKENTSFMASRSIRYRASNGDRLYINPCKGHSTTL